MIRTVCATAAAMLWLAGTAAAQQPARSFNELKRQISVGEAVSVVDASGTVTRGRVDALSDDMLTLRIDGARRAFGESDVVRIERRRKDSIRNGLLIGAGTGGLIGFGAGRRTDSPTCPRAGIECGQGAMLGTVGGAFWGAAGGWLVDALIRRREVVYVAR